MIPAFNVRALIEALKVLDSTGKFPDISPYYETNNNTCVDL